MEYLMSLGLKDIDDIITNMLEVAKSANFRENDLVEKMLKAVKNRNKVELCYYASQFEVKLVAYLADKHILEL